MIAIPHVKHVLVVTTGIVSHVMMDTISVMKDTIVNIVDNAMWHIAHHAHLLMVNKHAPNAWTVIIFKTEFVCNVINHVQNALVELAMTVSHINAHHTTSITMDSLRTAVYVTVTVEIAQLILNAQAVQMVVI